MKAMHTPRVKEIPVRPLKKRLAVDFDGVLHGYSKGWCGGKIYDDPVPYSREAMHSLSKRYELVIFTARTNLGDVRAWLVDHGMLQYFAGITNTKPLAGLYIDDRGLRFEGDWEATLDRIEELMGDHAS